MDRKMTVTHALEQLTVSAPAWEFKQYRGEQWQSCELLDYQLSAGEAVEGSQTVFWASVEATDTRAPVDTQESFVTLDEAKQWTTKRALERFVQRALSAQELCKLRY